MRESWKQIKTEDTGRQCGRVFAANRGMGQGREKRNDLKSSAANARTVLTVLVPVLACGVYTKMDQAISR